MSAALGVLAIVAVAGLWYVHLRARECALSAARRYCRERGLQFLDESVALVRLRPNLDGPLRAHRWYRFMVSDGEDVRAGEVELIGHRVVAIRLPDSRPPVT